MSVSNKVTAYTADSIQHLEGISAIRKRPGMYVGGATENTGVYRIAKEVADNCLDEYLAKHNSSMTILYDKKTHRVTVIDKGRGIPTGINTKTKECALTTVLTKMHAGGKFEQGAYQVSSGLHGIGIKATNALSSELQIWSNSGDGWHTQTFSRGVPQSKVSKQSPPKEYSQYGAKTGVILTYIPDKQVFTQGIALNTKRLLKEMRDVSFLCPRLDIKIVIDGKETNFRSEKGLEDYVTRGDENRADVFHYTSNNLEVALNWTSEDGETTSSYVNLSHTVSGGTHLKGLTNSISKVLKEYCKSSVDAEDLREGLVGAIHWKMSDPIYKGQTKEELSNPEATKEIETQLIPALQKYFAKNAKLAQEIATYAERMKAEKLKLKDTKNALKNIRIEKKGARGILPVKLTESDAPPMKRELYIVEGDSAGGTARKARESFQEVLKLRGKFSNAYKTTMEKLLASEEVQNIITSIGSNIGDQCNPETARVGKIVLLMDADVDGKHITSLALSLIVSYMPELIKQGRVYAINAPLFIASSAKRRVFGDTLKEVKKQIGKEAHTVVRLKGWGEANADELHTIAMNPETRRMYRISMDEDSEGKVINYMGEDVSHRKALLNIEV